MQSRVDVRKGVRAVDGWLAGAQQVEIRTMENENRTRRRVGRGHIWLLETIVTRVRATLRYPCRLTGRRGTAGWYRPVSHGRLASRRGENGI